MNNLYGWAMNEYLPYGGFKWLENITSINECNSIDKSPIGYFLEVDQNIVKTLVISMK